MASQWCLLVAVVLQACLEGTTGLWCYKCTNCPDPFISSGTTTINCAKGSCIKVTTEVSIHLSVTRDCDQNTHRKPEHLQTFCSADDYFPGEYCSCITDGCNTGVAAVSVSIALIVCIVRSMCLIGV